MLDSRQQSRNNEDILYRFSPDELPEKRKRKRDDKTEEEEVVESASRLSAHVDHIRLAIKRMNHALNRNLDKIEEKVGEKPQGIVPIKKDIEEFLSFSRFAASNFHA